MHPSRIEPGPGQESVWDYPRPPRVEPTQDEVVVVFGGTEIARTSRALRVLETSHPPGIYLPPKDISLDKLEPVAGTSFCEWKGSATYFDVVVGDFRSRRAAWSYLHPLSGFDEIGGFVSFYPARVDRILVSGEEVTPQAGEFYGGWITSKVSGPFKGEPGSTWW